MKEMEKVVQEETFEIEVQYCDPNDCLHDCIHSGVQIMLKRNASSATAELLFHF